MHLVLLGVRERLLPVPARGLRLHPAHEGVGQVDERTGRLVAVAGGVGDGVRLQEGRRLAVVELDPRAPDVDERVRAGGLVAIVVASRR